MSAQVMRPHHRFHNIHGQSPLASIRSKVILSLNVSIARQNPDADKGQKALIDKARERLLHEFIAILDVIEDVVPEQQKSHR